MTRRPEIIYIDMDGVLCDFQKEHDKRLKEYPMQQYPQAAYGFFESICQEGELAPLGPRR